MGIQNTSITTLDDVISLTNVTSLPEFLVNINQIYDGFYWLIIIGLIWIISFVAAQKVSDNPLPNAMYVSMICSILSLLARGIQITRAGEVIALLTDFQMWIFPLITIVIAFILWINRED